MANPSFKIGLLFDDTLDSNDGVAQQVKRIGEWFSQNGHQVVYLCGDSKTKQLAGGKVYSLSKNIKVIFNGNRLSMPLLSHSKDINDALATEKLDVLHVTTPYSPLMAQRVIRRAYKNTAIVGTFHILPAGILTTVGSRLLRVVQWFSLRKFDVATSVSSSSAEFARQNFGIKSIVIPNAVDLDRFRLGKPAKRVDDKIVFLGRLVKRKGCKQLIEAFSLLVESRPQSKLEIAGDGVERHKLEKMVAKLGLQDKVSFLGFIKEEDKASFLASAAIACFPSLYGESFGVVLIEAMGAGSGVVIGGDNPGYETVLGKQPQLLFNPKDKAAFAARLSKILSDKSLAKKLHYWQQIEVKQYDIKLVGPRILAVYQHAIVKKNQRRHN